MVTQSRAHDAPSVRTGYGRRATATRRTSETSMYVRVRTLSSRVVITRNACSYASAASPVSGF